MPSVLQGSGLALVGGKGPGLRLFVSKGGQTQSLQLSQGSQICHILHNHHCKPGVYFLKENLTVGAPLHEQDVVLALVAENLLLQ